MARFPAERTCRNSMKSDTSYYPLCALKSYLQTCFACGMTTRAYQTFLRYIHPKTLRNRSARANFNDPELFNIVLRGLASCGEVQPKKVQHVLEVMQMKNVKPNHDTIASLLLLGFTNQAMDIADKRQLPLSEVMSQTQYSDKERNIILRRIREAKPEFEGVKSHQNCFTNPQYLCELLDGLRVPVSREWNTHDGLFDKQKLASAFARQMKIELDGFVKVKSVALQPHTSKGFKSRDNFKRKLYENFLSDVQRCWHRQLHRNVLMEKLKLSQAMRNVKHMNIEPFLNCISAKELSDILYEEVSKLCSLSEEYSDPMFFYYERLADRLMKKFHVHLRQRMNVFDKVRTIYAKYAEFFVDNEISVHYNHRQFWQLCACQLYPDHPSVVTGPVNWSYADKQEIGRQLFSLILDSTLIPSTLRLSGDQLVKGDLVPAFYTVFRDIGARAQEELRLHPTLIKLMRTVSPTHINFEPTAVPMVCPPVPWHSTKTGYYLISEVPFIRLHYSALPVAEMEKAVISEEEVFPAIDCLNQLSGTPWVINNPVLDIMLSIFREKGDEALDIPPPPWTMPSFPKIPKQRLNTKEMAAYFKERYEIKKMKNENYSLWCSALYKLSVANHYRNDIIWFPHNLDFRGRVYPCPPHLHHMGDDVCRGLLLFAKGRVLGKRGFEWLKIHCVNLTGLKKRESLSARLQYANDILHEIVDSATRPLDGRRWWTKSEEPWQTLACCMEIANALNCQEGADRYVSHFPIHQDGSCNGLQHYAALGRDAAGAFHVNLCASDTPQDVYSGVASLIENKRAEDAKGFSKVARRLGGFVQRKVVKQTVMTTVYGVTRYGARHQISRQLKLLTDFPKELEFEASKYLMQKTFESLGQMFSSARAIQQWLTELASLISKDCRRAVQWKTPLNFPVVQPYYRSGGVAASVFGDYGATCKGSGLRKSIYGKLSSTKPDSRKQRNGFPPNFIHSLDSSHMMLTSLFCQHAGLTFASVHDCFWTHASTVDVMNRILREQFVALHSRPILEDLSKFLITTYIDHAFWTDKQAERRAYIQKQFSDLPKKGNFDITEVLRSTYFFN
ncbi:DNA directed RNA polymerase, mitochondrial [Trichuris trichiura]|uniref:DNA-directed RNA polymerase n=1 Tax=Trichuris trichiura TaxID=36087 RepID=A0A077ZFJ4_TRITR|nr:DNA directed RNA polymerase, mitochondrial [Trichuris trichiura]